MIKFAGLILLCTCIIHGIKSERHIGNKYVRNLPNDDNCGVQHYRPHGSRKRIVGGVEVVPNSWPWMVMMKFDGHLTCGGTLVRNNNGTILVVTSAICVDGILGDATRWELRLGVYSRHSAEHEIYFEKFKIRRIVKHLDYNPSNLQNDIALVFIDGDVQVNNGVSPACVTNSMYQIGENCVSLGWGLKAEQGESSDRLQEVYKPIQDPGICSTQYGPIFDNNTMICAGLSVGGAGPCDRDSGGPLLCKRNNKWYLTGIISWGFGCANADFHPVYTNVFNYVTSGWLRTNGDI